MASSEKQNNSFLLNLLGSAATQGNATVPTAFSNVGIHSAVPILSNAQTARSDPKFNQHNNIYSTSSTTIPAATNDIKSAVQFNNTVNQNIHRNESLSVAISDNNSAKPRQSPASKPLDLEDNKEFLAKLLDNVTSQSQSRSRPFIPTLPMTEAKTAEKIPKKNIQPNRKRQHRSDYDALEAFYGVDDTPVQRKKAKRNRKNKAKPKNKQLQHDETPSLNNDNGQLSSNGNPTTNALDILAVANEVLGRDPRQQKMVQDIYREASSLPNTSKQHKAQSQQPKKIKRHPGKEPRDKTLPPLNTQVPCKFYKSGKCKEGKFCRFIHDGDSFRMVCRHYKTGSCNKGDECNYSHDLSIEPCRFFHLTGKCDTGPGCPYSHAPLDQDLRRRLHLLTGPCKYYHLKGFCTNGEGCLFSHDYLNQDELKEFKSTVGPLSETNSIKFCTFFHIRGSCANGDKCTFSHDPITAEQKKELEKYLPKYDGVK